MINKLCTAIRWSLYALLLFLPSVFYLGFTQNFQFPKTVIFQMTIALLSLLGIIHLWYTKKIHPPKNELLFWIILTSFILSFLASTGFSLTPQISLWGNIFNNEGLFQVIHLMLWTILVYHFFTKDDFSTFLEVILASAILPSLIALGQYFGDKKFFLPLGDALLGRTIGTLGQPNFLGQFLALTILINIFLLLRSEKRLLHLISFLVMFGALFTTGSRAGFLSLGIGLAIFCIFYLQKIAKKHTLIIFIALCVILVSIPFLIRFNTDGMRSMQSRLIMWESLLPALQKLPPFGYGLETMELIYDRYKNPKIYEYELFTASTQSAHNIFLDILIARGYFGLITATGLLGFLFWKGWKHRAHIEIWFLLSLFLAWTAGIMLSFGVINQYLILFGLTPFFLKYTTHSELRVIKNYALATISIIFVIFATFSVWINIQNIKAESYFFQFAIAKNLSQKEQFLSGSVQKNHRQKIYLDQAITFFMQNSDYKKLPSLIQQSLHLNNYLSHKNFLVLAIANAYLFQDMEKSQILFNSAQSLAPNEATLYLLWGDALFDLKYYKEAAENFEKYLALLPPYWQWDDALDTKSFEKKEKYRLFFKTFPNFRTIFERLATAYSALNNEEKAQYYQKFAK